MSRPALTKKHFISLADALRECQSAMLPGIPEHVLDALCRWMSRENPNFNRHRWLGYLRGECGPNGGTLQ